MATYVIGDVQGCYSALTNLLNRINFQPSIDKLWFCGDIINRGENSLATLRQIKGLGDSAITVLGNHDLHLLAIYYGQRKIGKKDTIGPILEAEDSDELMHWLRHRPLAHYDAEHDVFLCHAGVYPQWSRAQATALASEVESILQNDDLVNELFTNMYGNHPKTWSEDLKGWDRIRFIINAFTRMRYCTEQGKLDLKAKGAPGSQPVDFVPWYMVPKRPMAKQTILFGHWASLEAESGHPFSIALDSGCVWGGELTAYRLEDRQFFSVECC